MSVAMNDTVKVHYTGKFENNEVFDTSKDREPFAFRIGAGHVIEGFEEAIMGMEPGQSKTVSVSPEKGYGTHNPDQVIEMPISSVPEGFEIAEGMPLQLQDDNGRVIPVMVVEITDTTVKLDANHPLAGKTLVFDIELLEIGCEIDEDEHGCGCGCDDEDCEDDCDSEGNCGNGCCGCGK